MLRFGIVVLTLALTGCATQRFGRLTPLSDTERRVMSCRDIQLETARAEQFLAGIRRTRSGTNAAHVLGFIGDFGIGNVMEGDEAEASGEARLRELSSLAIERHCMVRQP